jgi:hypothetical protein
VKKQQSTLVKSVDKNSSASKKVRLLRFKNIIMRESSTKKVIETPFSSDQEVRLPAKGKSISNNSNSSSDSDMPVSKTMKIMHAKKHAAR